jgi:hypothetical protein
LFQGVSVAGPPRFFPIVSAAGIAVAFGVTGGQDSGEVVLDVEPILGGDRDRSECEAADTGARDAAVLGMRSPPARGVTAGHLCRSDRVARICLQALVDRDQ